MLVYHIHVHGCVFDTAWTTGSTLDLKLARFLREKMPVSADLGGSFLLLFMWLWVKTLVPSEPQNSW